uniref:Beta-defensin-like domain-containing protein n=1 Tax=Malurus cyaneus samueli TaxID=2593467 RepID=A0A8C5TCL9_9PASS
MSLWRLELSYSIDLKCLGSISFWITTLCPPRLLRKGGFCTKGGCSYPTRQVGKCSTFTVCCKRQHQGHGPGFSAATQPWSQGCPHSDTPGPTCLH